MENKSINFNDTVVIFRMAYLIRLSLPKGQSLSIGEQEVLRKLYKQCNDSEKEELQKLYRSVVAFCK